MENERPQSRSNALRERDTRRDDTRPNTPDALVQFARLLARQAARDAVAAQQSSQNKSPEPEHE